MADKTQIMKDYAKKRKALQNKKGSGVRWKPGKNIAAGKGIFGKEGGFGSGQGRLSNLGGMLSKAFTPVQGAFSKTGVDTPYMNIPERKNPSLNVVTEGSSTSPIYDDNYSQGESGVSDRELRKMDKQRERRARRAGRKARHEEKTGSWHPFDESWRRNEGKFIFKDWAPFDKDQRVANDKWMPFDESARRNRDKFIFRDYFGGRDDSGFAPGKSSATSKKGKEFGGLFGQGNLGGNWLNMTELGSKNNLKRLQGLLGLGAKHDLWTALGKEPPAWGKKGRFGPGGTLAQNRAKGFASHPANTVVYENFNTGDEAPDFGTYNPILDSLGYQGSGLYPESSRQFGVK